jgi:uncharacterized lipoprotein YehR (DUF1307 family)
MKNILLTFSVILVVLISVSLHSCKDKEDTYNISYEYDYFPTDSGHFIIYDVDSIVYSSQKVGSGGGFIQKNDTARYQLMELYAGEYFDTMQGILKYRIEYYKRKTKDQAWQQDRVWWATRTVTNIQRQEDDLKFVKLVFPPRENATWNGTIYIPPTGQYQFLENWNFKMTDVGVAKTIGAFNFSKTLVVTHVDTDDGNLITNQLSRETYAKGVGIVYKEWDNIEKQDVLSNWANPQNANGFRIRMTVADYFPK